MSLEFTFEKQCFFIDFMKVKLIFTVNLVFEILNNHLQDWINYTDMQFIVKKALEFPVSLVSV